MKLLINESPFIVLPTLVELIGVNEAIFLQQLHYWLDRSNNYINGRRWCYRTNEEWAQELRFLSVSTIKRIKKRLKDKGIIITGCFNKASFDRTTWYTIDYDALENMVSSKSSTATDEIVQEKTDATVQRRTNAMAHGEPTNTNRLHNRILQENTHNISGKPDKSSPRDPNKDIRHEIIGYWNTKYNRKFKADIANTKKKINARIAEGFEIEDFKKVIDFKTKEWKNTEFEKYLVPDTLFSEKFEKYISQAECKPTNSDLGEYSRGEEYKGLW